MSEQPPRVGGRQRGHLGHGDPARRRQPRDHVCDKGWFAAPAAVSRRGLVGRIGLREQQLGGNRARRLDRPPRVRIGDRTREREAHPEIAVDTHELLATRVAVQHATNLVRSLLPQDPRRRVVRTQHVDHQRQLRLARGPDVGAEQRLLPLHVGDPTVEPALTDRDRGSSRTAQTGEDLRDHVIVHFPRCQLRHHLRMDPHCDPDFGPVRRTRRLHQPRPRARPDRRHQHTDNTRHTGTRKNRVAVGVEGFDVEVAVGIDHDGGGRGSISVVKLVRQWSHWWRTSESLIARWTRAAHAALLGEMPVLAAGTALFAIIAIVPTLAAAVAIYGLVADPLQIHDELATFRQVMPAEVVMFIGDQLEAQAQRSHSELGLQLGVSVVLALVSARGSARALIDALNRAYRVRELRTSMQRMAMAFLMALATLVGLMLMFALLVILPGIVAAINEDWVVYAMWLRWPSLLALVFVSLLALYRYAPSPRPLGPREQTDSGGPVHLPHRPVRHVCLPGAGLATVLLVLVSWGLSLWVDNIASKELVYGAFGSAIVTILWFYLSTMTLMIGGFVNAELERHAGAPQPDRSMY